MIDRAALPGGPRHTRGYFPQLTDVFGAGAFDPQGSRLSDYLTSLEETTFELRDAWDELRDRVANQTVTGPLDAAAADAGRGHPDHLQRRITEQLEQIERDQLHRDMQQLPTTDTRRLAWYAVDRLSSQWVSSWPTHRMELSLHEMREVVTTYLGRESPAVRRLAGQHIPCSHASRQGQGRVCDAYGFQLGLATLPGGSNEECHEVAGRELFEIIQEARLSIELQPRHFFHTLIPVARLLQPGRHPSIVPDASMRVALADVVTQRPPAQRGPVRCRDG